MRQTLSEANQRAVRRRALISRVESGYSARTKRAPGVLSRTVLHSTAGVCGGLNQPAIDCGSAVEREG